jgi:hypothetical protein
LVVAVEVVVVMVAFGGAIDSGDKMDCDGVVREDDLADDFWGLSFAFTRKEGWLGDVGSFVRFALTIVFVGEDEGGRIVAIGRDGDGGGLDISPLRIFS